MNDELTTKQAAENLAREVEAFKRELDQECVKSGNRTLDNLIGEARIYNDANYRWAYAFARMFEKVEKALLEYGCLNEAEKVDRGLMAMKKWLAKTICKFFGHKELDIAPMFINPKKGDAICRSWDCPRCGEGTFKNYVWRPNDPS